MVPLSKSGVRKHRGFEIPPSPPQTLDLIAPGGVSAGAPRSRTVGCARSGARTLSCQERSCRRSHVPRFTSRTRRVDVARTTGERSPSGLWRRTGNAVRGNPSRVRIPPSPPLPVEPRRHGISCRGRARRGTSGALYLQSAPAGLNPLPRTPSPNAARRCDVEDRVPRSGEPRTVSGPEGSSTKRSSPGAAERPGPSRSSWWARGRVVRRRVHGTFDSLALDRRRS